MLLALSGCGEDGERAGTAGESLGGGATADGDVDGGDGDGGDAGDGDGDGDGGDGDGDGDGGMPPKFDIAPGDGDGDGDGFGGIPETCAEAPTSGSTVGCKFFTVDLDQIDGDDSSAQFAATVSNVQTGQAANVLLEQKVNGSWETVEGPVTVPALDLYTFEIPDFHQEETGIKVGGAMRITSDVPVVAYQFSPLDTTGSSASSDASMLYPVHAWDHINQVVGWYVNQFGFGTHGAYFTVAAAHDGTSVEITPSIAWQGGGGVAAGTAGQTITVDLDEGDIVEIMSKNDGDNFSGTKVNADPNHPVAVFSAGECLEVLAYSCDHVEIQMAGVRFWGKDHVAARVPPRLSGAPETSVWQIYASEDGTTVTLESDPAVTGLPSGAQSMDQGDVLELEVGGTAGQPGDFLVRADQPIAVMNYMTGSSLAGGDGDPAMVQMPPAEQFLDRYVVLVPTTWDEDYVTITRETGAQVAIDGTPIPDMDFVSINADWEVARVLVADGVHVLEGAYPFGVVVAGVTGVDSYAYTGGVGTAVINPTPAG